MLTERQREKCRRIAQALDRGERVSMDTCSPEERGLIWDSRAHVKAQAERRRQRDAGVLPPHGEALKREAAVLEDLDYWPLASQEPDGDDDTRVCGACNGNGRDAAGNVCRACSGTGKAPSDGDEDTDDEDEEQ
jgi:hypothetical protein